MKEDVGSGHPRSSLTEPALVVRPFTGSFEILPGPPAASADLGRRSGQRIPGSVGARLPGGRGRNLQGSVVAWIAMPGPFDGPGPLRDPELEEGQRGDVRPRSFPGRAAYDGVRLFVARSADVRFNSSDSRRPALPE